MKEMNFGIGFLTGLSVGIYCLGLCLPVFLPVLLSQKRDAKKSFLLVLEFSAGRLAGYVIFGLIFGWLGQLIQNRLLHTLVSLGNLWMGIVLILFALGQIDKKFCSFLPLKKIKWPILLGLLTGVNVCPPFLISLGYVFNLQSTVNAIVYFIAFFLGTSTYLIPSVFLGLFTRFTFIQKIARISGVVAGIYFISRNIPFIF
jgi:sulfite exporter TauE/SafE